MAQRESPESIKVDASTQIDVNLAERVTRLERKSDIEESLMKRSSSFVGVVALFFSITVGGYTIWEKAVVEPRKSEASKTEDIRRIVSRIGELNRQVIDAQYENVAKAAALGRLANGEKLGLLSKAESIIESIEHRFDFSEYFVLAFEQLNAGNNELAIRYYELAYQAAPKDLPKTEALRGYAQAVFAQGPNQDIDYARTQFQKALNHASKAKTYVALASQAQHLRCMDGK